jgi:hypothetical protein
MDLPEKGCKKILQTGNIIVCESGKYGAGKQYNSEMEFPSW